MKLNLARVKRNGSPEANRVRCKMQKQCDKCQQMDYTDCSSCQYCGTPYSYKKPSRGFRLQPQHCLLLGLGTLLLSNVIMPMPPDAVSNSPHVYWYGRFGGRSDLLAYPNYLTWLTSRPYGPFLAILSWFLLAGSLAWAFFLTITKDTTSKL